MDGPMPDEAHTIGKGPPSRCMANATYLGPTPAGQGQLTSAIGAPLPLGLRDGPVVLGMGNFMECGRSLRAAVFLAKSLGRPVLVVRVHRQAVPLVEGYIPIPADTDVDQRARIAEESTLSAQLAASGEMADVAWELIATTGDAAAELIRIVEERDASTLVVGRRLPGLNRFMHRMTTGSISRALISKGTFPVLVVP